MDPVVINQTEDTIIAATLKMIVKLSEASFRPMYFKVSSNNNIINLFCNNLVS